MIHADYYIVTGAKIHHIKDLHVSLEQAQLLHSKMLCGVE
jgi:hypothetical protein